MPAGGAWLPGDEAYLSVARAWLDRGEPERARATLAPLLAVAERVPWMATLAAALVVDGRALIQLGERESATAIAAGRRAAGRRARAGARAAGGPLRAARTQLSSPRLAAARPRAAAAIAVLGDRLACRNARCNPAAMPVQPPGGACGGEQSRRPGRVIMAINEDKLNEFLGRFVTDLGRHRRGRQRGDRAPARPVQGASGRARHRRPAGGPDADRSAVHRRMAARAGGRRVRPVRRGHRHLLDDRGAGLRAGQPGRRGIRAGRVRARAGGAAGRAADHRGVPQRHRGRLERAGRGRVHRLRAVLPSRLHRQSRPVLDPGAGRRGRTSSSPAPRSPTSAAASAHPPSCSRRNTRTPGSPARTITRGRSSWRASGPATRGSPTG